MHDYCQACHTRFAVFSLLPSFCVSWLMALCWVRICNIFVSMNLIIAKKKWKRPQGHAMTSTQSKPPQNGRILKRCIYCLLFHWSQSSSPAVSYSPRGVRLFEQDNSKLLFWLVVLSWDWDLRSVLDSLGIRRFWGGGGKKGKRKAKGETLKGEKIAHSLPPPPFPSP